MTAPTTPQGQSAGRGRGPATQPHPQGPPGVPTTCALACRSLGAIHMGVIALPGCQCAQIVPRRLRWASGQAGRSN
jgi:hypothetical protein